MNNSVEIFIVDWAALLLRLPLRHRLCWVGSQSGVLRLPRALLTCSVLSFHIAILVTQPWSCLVLLLLIDGNLNDAGCLKEVTIVSTEATLGSLKQVDVIQVASEVIARISTLDDPTNAFSLAGIKQSHVLSLAAHFLMLMAVELTLVWNSHHLWDGICCENNIWWLLGWLRFEPVNGFLVDARFAGEVFTATILAVAIHNPKVKRFLCTISSKNRYSLCINSEVRCSCILVCRSVRESKSTIAFFTHRSLQLNFLSSANSPITVNASTCGHPRDIHNFQKGYCLIKSIMILVLKVRVNCVPHKDDQIYVAAIRLWALWN